MSWFLVVNQAAQQRRGVLNNGSAPTTSPRCYLTAAEVLYYYQHFYSSSTALTGSAGYAQNVQLWRRLLAQKAHLWSMEMLLKFGVNNNFVIFQTPVVPGLVTYKNHLVTNQLAKKFNMATHSEMIFGFTTGRCGFVRNQKRTFLATEVTMRTALWFCKRIYKFLGAIKIGLRGLSRNVPRYFKTFRRFELGHRQVKIHSLVDLTPVPYNGTRQKMRGRKRYRYHKYTYRRFAKMLKVNKPKVQPQWSVSGRGQVNNFK
jgi:ribosomal protein S11